ncbi:MAG: 7-cyano-7-deazaguanine synthase QueC [Sedimentisphaerales bacterium]|nr:7-cyano-7-deazaguanine synthase QueC [Sedimentisphaerales bacterium]
MSTKAVILHSGGLDSTTCLLLALEKGREIISLGIDYGQKSRAELEYAIKLCDRFNVSRKVLNVSWDKPNRTIPKDRKINEIGKDVSTAFLPGRNALFLVLGCAEAAGIGASEVWIGINSIDYSGYPDCRPEFLEQFKKMMQLAIPKGPKIIAPLISLTKPEIAKEAYRLGIRQGDTWSCYRPKTTENGFVPCGKCDACILHKYAWENITK